MLGNIAFNATLLMMKIKSGGSELDISLYGGETPNLAFNASMVAIWGVLLAAQIVQIFYKQYWFSVALICTGILEVLGYIGRTWSHSDTTLMDPFLLNMICLTIAPVFTMGGIYYQLAKLLEIYGPKFGLWKPIIYSYVFIACDIVSLVIQAIGGGVAGSAVADEESSKPGTHIFVAGLTLQLTSMLIFIVLWFHFLYHVYIKTRMEHAKVTKFSWDLFRITQADIDYMYRPKYAHIRQPNHFFFHYFPFAITAAVITILTRCAYRLGELSEGWTGNLITHEWYFIILDALMMSIATLFMTVFHPGFAFSGRTQSIPIDKRHRNKRRSTDPENPDDSEIESTEQSSTNEDEKKDPDFQTPIVDGENPDNTKKHNFMKNLKFKIPFKN